MKEIINAQELQTQLKRLAVQLIAKHPNLTDVVIIGIQQGGVVMADELVIALQDLCPSQTIQYGQLDITFYRDDIRREIHAPDAMNIPFGIENKIVVLIDDVLFTGRTIKAALDVLLDYGRPDKVELCVLIDRKEHRQFPIQADYVGLMVQTNKQEKVKLVKQEDGSKHVILING
ncbi:MAG: bifunctional pyr operon transcriptional regulator/uracil phosphoribosyltransferase PyrR [Chitinophagaceae bacterium]